MCNAFSMFPCTTFTSHLKMYNEQSSKDTESKYLCSYIRRNLVSLETRQSNNTEESHKIGIVSIQIDKYETGRHKATAQTQTKNQKGYKTF